MPWLLLKDATPKHIGTLDIDLSLDPEALADGEYATLVETLEDQGYERDTDELRPFQLRRQVRVDDGPEISVLVDLLMPRDAKTDSRKEKLLKIHIISLFPRHGLDVASPEETFPPPRRSANHFTSTAADAAKALM